MITRRGRFFTLALALAATSARADDSFFESIGRATGMISPAPDPADFVKASRPHEEPTSIPVYASPEEPRSKVKSAAELKAMDADLVGASRRGRKKP